MSESSELLDRRIGQPLFPIRRCVFAREGGEEEEQLTFVVVPVHLYPLKLRSPPRSFEGEIVREEAHVRRESDGKLESWQEMLDKMGTSEQTSDSRLEAMALLRVELGRPTRSAGTSGRCHSRPPAERRAPDDRRPVSPLCVSGKTKKETWRRWLLGSCYGYPRFPTHLRKELTGRWVQYRSASAAALRLR